METKYPNCVVPLSGTDGNAVLVFMRVARALKRYLIDEEGHTPEEAHNKAEEFKREAKSGAYANVLTTCHRWVTVT